MVAIAENARIPIDNPATHLELTMVHEAMVLEYSGRHLALIDLSSELKLLLYISIIGCLFVPWVLRHRTEALLRSPLALCPMSPSFPLAASCWRFSKRQSQRCVCSAYRPSSVQR